MSGPRCTRGPDTRQTPRLTRHDGSCFAHYLSASSALVNATGDRRALQQRVGENPHCADKHGAYPRAPYRGRGLRTVQQLNWRLPVACRHTVRQAARAYIDTVMSDKTGVHPVAVRAVNPRITATVILLVMPDITHSIRPDLCPTQIGARSMASGGVKNGRSRLRTTNSWHEGAHHRIQTRFGRCRY